MQAMIHAGEIQNDPSSIQVSMMFVETAETPLDSSIFAAGEANSGRPGELTLTGSQVLAGCVSVLGTVGLLVWAVIRLWLFEP
jgi:hypothetical protein